MDREPTNVTVPATAPTVLLLTLASLAPLFGQQAPAASRPRPELELPGPRLVCNRAVTPPVIDGKLDDACWEEAIVAGNYLLSGGRGLANQRTQSRVAYDGKYIYFACLCKERCLDPALNQLDKFKATIRTRDSLQLFGDDCVELFIAPGEDPAGYYHIGVNSLGVVYDSKGMSQPKSWDAEIQARGKLGHEHWTLEIAVPLASLSAQLPVAGHVWRLNLCRTERPQEELYSSWAPVSTKGFHSPECFGYLVFGSLGPWLSGPEIRPLKMGRNTLAATVGNPCSRPLDISLRLVATYDREETIVYEVTESLLPGAKKDVPLSYRVQPDNRCMKLDALTTRTEAANTGRLPIKPNTEYLFSAMVKVEDYRFGHKPYCFFYIQPYSADGERLSKGYMPLATVAGEADEWHRVTGAWRPPRRTATAVPWIVAWKGHGSGTVWMDDISLTEKGTAEDIIPNGTFPKGSESVKWPVMTRGLSFDDSYGAGAGTLACYCQLVCRDAVLYQSPSFVRKIDKAPDVIISQLVHLCTSGEGIQAFRLENLHVAEGTAERIVLLLESPVRTRIDKAYVDIETPDFCELVNAFERRKCISPIQCTEKKTTRDGRPRRTYTLVFGQDAVADADRYLHEILPVPLLLRVVGAPASDSQSNVYYRAKLDETRGEPREHRMALTPLPPLCGVKPHKLPLVIWGPRRPYLYQLSAREQGLLVSKWGKAGYNYTTASACETQRFLEHGLRPFTLLPTITIWHFPGHMKTEYLEKYPEHYSRDPRGRKNSYVCLAHLIEPGCGFRDKIREVIGRYVRAFPHHVNWDYEFAVCEKASCGFSERNIELFRKRAKIPTDVELTPSAVLGKYRKQWIDFRCWENGELARVYRECIKEANPNCLFSFYSGYQSPHTAERYGVDWRYVGKYVDLCMCGYSRGRFQQTRDAIGGRYLNGGELIWGGYYDLDGLECTIFRRLTDCGSFMTFLDWIYDGRLFVAVSRAASVASDFEEFFLLFNRHDSLVTTMQGEPRADVAVLTHEGERLIFIFNGTPSEKQATFRNVSVPAGMIAIDHDTKEFIREPGAIETTVAPRRVKVIFLKKAAAEAKLSACVKLEAAGPSSRPIFRWQDEDGGSHKYTVQCTKDERFRAPVTFGGIPRSCYRPEEPISLGDRYCWRVRAIDVASGEAGPWSKPAKVKPKPVEPEGRILPNNDSIESLGCWVRAWSGVFATLESDYEVTRSGTYSLKIAGLYKTSHGKWTNWGRPYGTRLPRVKQGEDCGFSAWVKTEGEELDASLSIGFLNEKGKRLRSSLTAKVTGTRDWKKLTATGKPPKGAVNLYLSLNARGAGAAWFDEFELRRH